MKKLIAFFVVFGMAMCGTAMAADTVDLSNYSGVSRVYNGPVVSSAPGGVTAYVTTGSIFNDPTAVGTGTTVFAISNTLTNTAGTQLNAKPGFFASGTTPIGPAQLVSGTTDSYVLYVMPGVTAVGNSATGGNTLYYVNGSTGGSIWQLGIPTGIRSQNLGPASVFDLAATGASPISLAPVVIDTTSLATAGATIYGVASSGLTHFGVDGAGLSNNGPGGVSVFAVNGRSGTYSTTNNAVTQVTAFQKSSGSGSGGVSVIQSAPFISGDSLYVIGYSNAYAAVTMYAFDKNNLRSGVSAAGYIQRNAILADQFIPTPCVAGNSIFVVTNQGGVSSYNKTTLALNYGRYYAANGAVLTGVSASPVTDGSYLVLCSTSAVTCFGINDVSSNVRKWAFDFGAGANPLRFRILATPVISNGYVFVTASDMTNGSAATYRFTLNSTTGSVLPLATHPEIVYGSGALAGSDLWLATFNPRVQKVSATGARGDSSWPQFKFDAAKTGNNTVSSHAAPEPGDDSGCFISTIK